MAKIKLRNVWMKIVKFAIKNWANEELIPAIQAAVNAGAVDKAIDKKIAETVRTSIAEI